MFAALHFSGLALAPATTGAARSEPSSGVASGAGAAARTRAPSPALAGEGGSAVTAVATLRSDAVAALQAGDASAQARKDERDPAATSALAAKPASEDDEDGGGAGALEGEDLSPEEETQVRDLKKRDAEVKQHEQAHASVGGPYAGSPSYQYTRGPDGKRYAVSGEVPIDASAEREPEQTIRKMEIVIRAALAPAEPSPQDRQVAAQASQTRSEAQAKLQKQRAEEQTGGSDTPATGLDAEPASARGDNARDAQAAEARRQAGAAVAAYRASEAATAGLVASAANGGRIA